jgi:hypothetical protein
MPISYRTVLTQSSRWHGDGAPRSLQDRQYNPAFEDRKRSPEPSAATTDCQEIPSIGVDDLARLRPDEARGAAIRGMSLSTSLPPAVRACPSGKST